MAEEKKKEEVATDDYMEKKFKGMPLVEKKPNPVDAAKPVAKK
jgi:hypothetical protein